MQVTDAWFAGQLGVTELAALTPAVALMSLLSIFGAEAATVITTHVSQSLGKNRPAACGRITWQGIYCGAFFGWLCLIYYPTAGVVFRTVFPSHSPALIAMETSYFQISLLGLAPLMVSTVIGNFLTGLGRTRTLMASAFAGVFANIGFSWALVFGKAGLPAMGFPGIAWGTLLATVFQAMVLLAIFLVPRRMREEFGTAQAGFSKNRAKRLVRLGMPAGLHGCMDYLAWGVVLTWLISFSGEAHIAAQTIMVRCITLSFLPAEGLSSALTTLVGKAVGARDYLLARRYARAGFTINAIWMSVMALLYICFGEFIVRLFTDLPEVVDAGKTAILWVAAFQFFDAMNVTYSNALQGAGDVAWPSAVNFTISIVVLLGGGLAMVTFFPNTASSGVWAMATLYVIAHGILYSLRWKSRAWQNPKFLA